MFVDGILISDDTIAEICREHNIKDKTEIQAVANEIDRTISSIIDMAIETYKDNKAQESKI